MYLIELEDEVYNTGITVKLLEISRGAHKGTIATFELCYPLFIHAQLLTHRVFARNSTSMRAIPTERVIEAVQNTPAKPATYKMNQAGMVGGDTLDKTKIEPLWFDSRDAAIGKVRVMQEHNVHKEIINRQLSPYYMNKVIVSATEWENFFNLRTNHDAQDEIVILAKLIKKAYQSTHPSRLAKTSEWHLPYTTTEERKDLTNPELCMLSVARCAVVSYDKHEGGRMDLKKAASLWTKLLPSEGPAHLSAFEHTARIISDNEVSMIKDIKNKINFYSNDAALGPLAEYLKERLEFRGVHRGWCSLRWLLETENFKGPLSQSYRHLSRAISNGKTKS